MKTLKLTPAQRSALECAGLTYAENPRTRAAWDGGNRLSVPTGNPAACEELASEINELSNSEDALANEMKRRSVLFGRKDIGFARGAALALANLYGKVLQAGTVESE